ncbi:glycosyltransferase family 4 protein [Candidatus Woesearchaeota archaeon]|nr:glycosyltransferase family 4 protein [Candidatus Woesearchaeota archaeon]
MKKKAEKTIKITILSAFAENSALWKYGFFLNKHLSQNKNYEVKFIDLWKCKKYHSNLFRGFELLKGIDVPETDVLILVSPLLCNSFKKTNAKLKIAIVHDLHPITHPNEVAFATKIIVNKTYKNMKFADVLLPVSDFTKNDVQRIFHPKSKIKIKTIHGGIDHNLFKHSRNNKISEPFFLHIGRNDVRKNFVFALELMKKFEGMKLVKIGEVSGKERAFIMKNCLNVDVVGHVNEKKLAEYYKKASLLLVPSTYEGLGLPIAEAMACGCPVLAGNNTGMKEVCMKESLLSLNVGLWEERAEKILNNNKYKNEIVKKGIAKAKQFDWKKYAAEVEKIINKKLRRNKND